MSFSTSARGQHVLIIVSILAFISCVVAQGPQYPSYNNPNFKPSMTVTIIVLSVACLFIAFFSFYIRKCSRDVHINRGGLSLRRTRPAPRGLDASVIETFPTFLYSVVKGLKIGKEVLECAVCLNEFEDDETLRLLPKCNHVFHPECIDAWLSSHTTCPVCRADLGPNSSAQITESTESNIAPEEAESSGIQESSGQVTVSIDLKPDAINLTRFPIQNHPIRSKSTRFPRSHSTGHSLVQPGENHDRFTLKLPDDVRKQILNGKLNRTTSCVNFPTEASVSGWRNGSLRRSIGNQLRRLDGAGKSDRWRFPFSWRNNSAARSTKNGDAFVTAKIDGVGQSSSSIRPPV